MNSNNKIPQDCLLQRLVLSDKSTLPEERVEVDRIPLDDEPFVTIEYYENQQDPLVVGSIDESVDGSLNAPNLVSSANTKINIKVYHPFTSYVEEVPESSLSSLYSLYQRLPPKLGCDKNSAETEDANEGEVLLLSDEDSSSQQCVLQCPKMTSELERTLALVQLCKMDPNKGTKNRKDCKSEEDAEDSSMAPQLCTKTGQSEAVDMILIDDDDDGDDVICVEDELMREMAQQMLQKMAERRHATNELRQKKMAETALARQVIRHVMHPGSQQVQHSWHEVPSRAVNRVDSCVGQASDLVTPKQRREAAWARWLIQQVSRGYSLQQVIQELKSAPPNSRPSSPCSRQNQANVCGEPGAYRLPKAPSVPAKRVRLQKSSKARLTHRVQTPASHPQSSSSPVRSLQPLLPPYSQAFNRPDCYNRATKCESFVEEPVQGEQRFPVSEQRFPASYPSYMLPANEYQPRRAKMGSSLLSTVHPSHLLPPSSVSERRPGPHFL